MIKLQQYQPCPHREGDVCIKATETLGVHTPVSPALCAFTCRTNGGPFGGRETTPQAEREWLASMLKMTRANSVRKVSERYGTSPVSIHWPDNVEQIVEAYKHLNVYDWFLGVAFSGSSIIVGAKPRDLDIVIWVSDYRAYLRDRDAIEWPKTIRGQKVDAFPRQFMARGPFIALDPRLQMLWTSSLYAIIGVPEGVTTHDLGGGDYAPRQPAEAVALQPEAAWRALARPRADAAPKPCVPCSRRATT